MWPSNQPQRLGWTLALLFIFILRIPDVVRNPQFWAEDGSIFFRQNFCDGAAAIGKPYAGYFHLVPRLLAWVAGAFRPTWVPAFYIAVALILTGVVLYLLQSPRLALPLIPLLGLAIVLSPTGLETYGNLTNIQWFLALGVLALILMQLPESKFVIILEAAFVAIAGLTGPFVLLLLPVFVVKLMLNWHNRPARDRMLVLTAAASITSFVQVCALLNNPITTGVQNLPRIAAGDIPFFVGAAICTHTLGPLLQTFVRFLPGIELGVVAVGWMGLSEVGLLLIVVVSSLKRSQLRFERLALFYFASAVLLVTVFKFRHSLPALVPSGDGARYFLIPTVVTGWLLISAVQEPGIGLLAKILLALLLVSAVVGFRRDPFVNFNWPVWAHRLETGERPQIPINPPGWFIITDCRLPQPRSQ